MYSVVIGRYAVLYRSDDASFSVLQMQPQIINKIILPRLCYFSLDFSARLALECPAIRSMLASASYPSPFPVIVPEFLSPISRFHGSACLLFYFFTHRHWFFCHDANLLMILALLIGCWCPRLHPPSTYFIHSCHCRNSHSSISSLLDRILLFQSLFVFSENIPQRQGRLVSLNLW